MRVLFIAAVVLAGTAAAGGIGYLAWRARHRRPIATPPVVLHPPAVDRAVQARTASQIAPAQQQVHLHFHGVTAGDMDQIIDRTRKDLQP